MILGGIAFYWENDLPIETIKTKYANADSKFLKVDGMEVHFRDQGPANDSIPVVLLHGTGASLHTWEGWVAELSKTRRVITLDLPAYGITGPNPSGNYSMKAYSVFLKHFLDSIKVEYCILGGNSLGGSIAWNFALDNQPLVEKLILVDAGGNSMKPKSMPIAFQLAKIPIVKNLFKYVTPRFIVEGSLRNVYGNPDLLQKSTIDRYFDLSLRAGNRQAFVDRLSSTTMRSNRFEELQNLKIPVLIIWGKKDLLIPIEVEKDFEAILNNEKVSIFETLGHVPMEENPKETVIPVLKFIKN